MDTSHALTSIALCAALLWGASCSKGATSPKPPAVEAQNGFSEKQVQSSLIAAQPHHVVVAQLEHPGAAVDDSDSDGIAGQDTIPYHLANAATLTFCMQDDNDQAHRMTLTNGSTAVSVTAGEGCVTRTLPAGDYTQTLFHDGTGTAEDVNAVFIQPGFETVPQETLRTLAGGAGPAKSQTVGNCTFIDTWSLQDFDGHYLSAYLPAGGSGASPAFPIVTAVSFATETLSFITTVGATELFKVYNCGSGRLAFQSSQGGFLTLGGVAPLAGTLLWSEPAGGLITVPGPSEIFNFQYHDDATITLQAVDGGYLTTAGLDPSSSFQDVAVATGGGAGSWDLPGRVTSPLPRSHFIPSRQFSIDLLTGECRGCNLNGVSLADYNLSAADLSGASMQDAILTNAFLPDANLSNANLTGAHLDKVDFYQVSGNPTLAGATLYLAQFSEANLIDIDLSDAKLEGADFTSAQMLGANLQGITHVFGTANGRVSFANALLAGANFTNATFDGGDFTNSIFSTKTASVDLLVRNSPTTTVTQPYGFTPTIRPLSTTSNTTCPDGSNGPCATDEQWRALNPPVYEGYNDPNQW